MHTHIHTRTQHINELFLFDYLHFTALFILPFSIRRGDKKQKQNLSKPLVSLLEMHLHLHPHLLLLSFSNPSSFLSESC